MVHVREAFLSEYGERANPSEESMLVLSAWNLPRHCLISGVDSTSETLIYHAANRVSWGLEMDAKKAGAALLLVISIAIPSFTLLITVPRTASAYTPHAPIYINGNGAFTFANGVTGGAGTPSNPYVIEGWEIVASTAIGIEIGQTTASFVIRDVYVHSGGSTNNGIYLYMVSNGRVENATLTDNWNGIFVYTTSRNITITGSRASSNSYTGIALSAVSQVTVSGNQVFSNEGGISVQSSSNVAIVGNNVSSNGGGISFLSVPNSTIADNHVSFNGGAGIHVSQSDNVVVAGNDVTENAYGMNLFNSAAANVTGNVFTSDGLFLGGDSPIHFDSHTITPDNLVNGRPLRYHSNCAGLDVDGAPIGQILVASCQNVRIANLTISDVDVGIQAAYMNDLVLFRNNVSTTDREAIFLQSVSDVVMTENNASASASGGVIFFVSSNVTIADNDAFSNHGEGIKLTTVVNATLAGNRVCSSDTHGIGMVWASNILVTQNEVCGNRLDGIGIFESRNAAVTNNTALSNGQAGIHIVKTDNATVEGNEAASNGYGLLVGWGNLTIRKNRVTSSRWNGMNIGATNATVTENIFSSSLGTGIFFLTAKNVTVYHNWFTQNAAQAFDSGGPENSWDDGYPSGGNHWSDYGGPDACSGPAQDDCTGPDGIGDVPYVIDADSEDHYPLMPPPNTPPVAAFVVFPSEGTTATSFEVNASSSSDSQDPADALEVRWDWETDGAWDTDWSTEKNASHHYVRPGTYTIGLEVRDTGGLDNQTTRAVVVVNTPPIAEFTIVPSSGETQTNFTFDASQSLDMEDQSLVLQVRWDWEGDGVWDTEWTEVKQAQHRYDEPGTYGVRLEVRDTLGLSNVTSKDLVVSPMPDGPPDDAFNPTLLLVVLFVLVVAILVIAILLWRRRKRTVQSSRSPNGRPPNQ